MTPIMSWPSGRLGLRGGPASHSDIRESKFRTMADRRVGVIVDRLPMLSKHATIYLNDHLAGSVTAIEMLGLITSEYRGSDAGLVAEQIRDEVIADRSVLEALMQRLDVSQSTMRKTSAWLAEKGAQIKLRWDDPAGGSFRLQEAVEAISLGIEGKRLLWLLLKALSESATELQGIDYAELIKRAENQRARVELVRLAAGRSGLLVSAEADAETRQR